MTPTQTFPPVNQDGSPAHAGLPDSVTISDAIYQAWLDPRVLALLRMANGTPAQQEARFAQAQLLHAAGLPIDTQIVMWNWDVPVVMYLRQEAGLSFVYDYFGIGGGGSGTPPSGQLTLAVSINAADYPPFLKPAVPATPSTNLVGKQISANLYATGPGFIPISGQCNVSDGEQVTQNGVTYTAHVGTGLMGISAYFTKN